MPPRPSGPLPVDHVLRYGLHPEHVADLRLPPRQSLLGLVLLVHGGFWRQEWDRQHTNPIAADLTARGYAVASLEYRRLGGSGGWPATFDDIATAVGQVPALAGEAAPGVTDAPVALLGHSAGGQLVLWAAGRHQLPASSRWWLRTPPADRGTVALAPVADLTRADALGLDDGVVASLLDDRGPGRAVRLAEIDPCGLPPAGRVVVVHGDQDLQVPVELSRRYVRAVRTAGAAAPPDVLLDVVHGADHFALIDPASPGWPRVIAALERVLRPR